MPPTVVHAALAGLLGAAVLGRRLGPRGAVVVVLAGALADADALLFVVGDGLHNAVFHSLLLPLAGGGLLYHDTHRRESSVVRDRWGAYGVAVCWTAVLTYVVAGIGLDLFNVDGAAVLWPLDRRFYLITGRLAYTTQEGLVQTFVTLQWRWPPVVFESYPPYSLPTPLDPAEAPERVLSLVESGWQLLVVATGAVAVALSVRGEP